MNRLLALVALILFLADAAALFVWWTYPEPARRSVPDLPQAAPQAPGPAPGMPLPGTFANGAPPPGAAQSGTFPSPQFAPGQAPPAMPPGLPASPGAAPSGTAPLIVNTSKGPMSIEDAISIIAFAPPQAQTCIAQLLGPNAVERIRSGQLTLTQENVTKAEDCLDGAKSPPVSSEDRPRAGATP